MSLASAFLPSPTAIGITTTVLLLLATFAVVSFVAARRRAAQSAVLHESVPPSELDPAPSGWEPAARQGGDDGWRHEEERFRTPLDQVENYAIILLDPRGKPTSWNPGIRSVLGYEKAEFLQLAAADLYPPEARQSGAPGADLAEAKREGRFTVERWLVRKDGTRFWGSLSTSSVHDQRGHLLGFARRLRDLSQQKAVEEQLRRKQDSLELALEAAGLGTWEHDCSTGDEFMDARARALFGLADDEPPTPGRWLDAVHPDDRERTLERWERSVRERASLLGRVSGRVAGWQRPLGHGRGAVRAGSGDRRTAPLHRRRPGPDRAPPHRGAPAGESPTGGGRPARGRDRARSQQHARRHHGVRRSAGPEPRSGRPSGDGCGTDLPRRHPVGEPHPPAPRLRAARDDSASGARHQQR